MDEFGVEQKSNGSDAQRTEHDEMKSYEMERKSKDWKEKQMGQYYMVVNIDKEEKIVPWSLDYGAKIMEWGYSLSKINLAMINLLKERWANDRVYVVGDYADLERYEDNDDAWLPTLDGLIKEYNLGDDTLYSYASEHFEDVSGKIDTEYHGIRYIINKATRQYLDLTHCPIEWVFFYGNEAKISSVSPLALLLAMGNNRGGGDFHQGCHGYEYVGRWVSTSENIEVIDELPGGYYTEFRPEFTERNPLVPYTEAEAEINKVIEERKNRT